MFTRASQEPLACANEGVGAAKRDRSAFRRRTTWPRRRETRKWKCWRAPRRRPGCSTWRL